MSTKIEKLLKSYPELVRKRDCIIHQLAHFKGVSAEDVIVSMYTPRMDGERVQTSNLSDKTAQIALAYRERQATINQEWIKDLEKRFQLLNEEIVFIESALQSLSGKLSPIMWDMVVEGMTWNAIAEKYYVSQRMVGKYRKKAISELEQLYDEHVRQTAAFLLD